MPRRVLPGQRQCGCVERLGLIDALRVELSSAGICRSSPTNPYPSASRFSLMLVMSAEDGATVDGPLAGVPAATPATAFGAALLSSQCRLVGESECAIASSTEILPLVMWSKSACSKVWEPGARLCS